MGTNTALTVVSIVLVIAVVALVVWAFVIAPLVVPLVHGKHHPEA